ncbi:MAG: SDR family NAD(P)-dependent oxidoreductase [Candidatus Sumerlaeales bacterium]|nr:SDR family NAD(P)-dependent oxidoreductase [Candidatus Sumerlaeales bacterium]
MEQVSLQPMNAIIIGASSGIGAATAEQLAIRGYRVALLARREQALKDLAQIINQRCRCEDRAIVYQHDVTKYDEIPALFDKIVNDMGGIGLVLYCSGIMSDVTVEEFDFTKDKDMIDVNLLGMMAWVNQAADLFHRLKGGVIAAIASVAGDRGRLGQPGYNTSKGAQAIFLESMRNRLYKDGVRVITFKPGPVDTPLITVCKTKTMMITAEAAANRIVKFITKPNFNGTVYVPWQWSLIMKTIIHIPGCIFRRLGIY